MNVILLENVQNLGAMGAQVKVRGGFGRNFLIPQGKAVPATEANVAVFNEKRAELETKATEKLSAAKTRAEALNAVTIQITGKAGDEGKLFGSIGTRDIAEAVTAAGVELAKNEVALPKGPIRNIGDYEISIQLHTDVSASVNISIIAD